MIRCYFMRSLAPDATFNFFRPAIHDILPNHPWTGDDLDEETAGGWFLVVTDVTDAQHATLVADARVEWIPFATAQGAALPLSATIGDMSAANRNAARSLLESHHIPLADLGLATVLRHVIARIVRRKRIRQSLKLRYANWRIFDSQDFTESLSALISSIPTAKRNAISDRLQVCGYDPSVIIPTDTIAQALQKLAAQNVAPNSNAYD